MICRNCHKEIGQQPSCQHCGFNPSLDQGGIPAPYTPQSVAPRPTEVTLLTSTNGAAVTSLILTLLVPIPLLNLFWVIFGIVGFFKAKKCRSGRALSIICIIINLLINIATAVILYYVITTQGITF